MNVQPTPVALTQSRAIDLYFMEHRAKLIDLAAFLDRVDRAECAGEQEDFRMTALRNAMRILVDGRADRVRRILEAFSDPTTEPIAKAPMKGAMGVYRNPTR